MEYSAKVEVILDENQLKEEIGFLKSTLKTKRRLASLRADQGLESCPSKTRVPYEHSSTKITLLMDWVRTVCDFYNLKVSLQMVTKGRNLNSLQAADFYLDDILASRTAKTHAFARKNTCTLVQVTV